MSVLKKISSAENKSFPLKIPYDLHDRIKSVKDRCKSAGFTVNFSNAAVGGIEKIVSRAEAELDHFERSRSEKTA